MADKTVTFNAPSGLGSVTAKVYPDGSTSIANGAGGDTASENGTVSGLYGFTIEEEITPGLHIVVLEVGSGHLGNLYVELFEAEGTYKAKDLAYVEELDDIYHADIDVVFDDDGAGADQYTIRWFKNGVPITSGITSPTIQVVKQFDGSDLIESNSMTQIGATGAYKYTASGAERVTSGDAIVVIVTATIDGASRTFGENNGRDLTV